MFCLSSIQPLVVAVAGLLIIVPNVEVCDATEASWMYCGRLPTTPSNFNGLQYKKGKHNSSL